MRQQKSDDDPIERSVRFTHDFRTQIKPNAPGPPLHFAPLSLPLPGTRKGQVLGRSHVVEWHQRHRPEKKPEGVGGSSCGGSVPQIGAAAGRQQEWFGACGKEGAGGETEKEK